MNLQKLFEIQRILDEKIVKEKGLEGQDLLDKKILALQVELGELANEWRGFKFWSEDNEPKRAYNKGCDNCVGGISKLSPLLGPYKECEFCRINPLLEEYVDCLHFILSIGLELGFEKQTAHSFKNGNSILGQFNSIYSELSSLYYHRQMYNYQRALNLIIGLGELLDFTWEEIEQSYYEKNRINHERQENGY